MSTEQRFLTLNIDELGNIELDSTLREEDIKTKLNYKGKMDTDWIASMSVYESGDKSGFSHNFLKTCRLDGVLYVNHTRLGVGMVYKREQSWKQSLKYRSYRDLVFIVREITDTEVKIEIFQTPLKAFKQLAKEAKK